MGTVKLADLLNGYTYPWLTMTIAGVVAVAAALFVHAVSFAVLRRLTKPSAIAGAIVEFTARPARAVLPLLALRFVMTAAPEGLRFQALASTIISFLLIGAVTWLGMRTVAGIGEAVNRLYPTTVPETIQARRIQTQTRVLVRVVMWFVLLIGIASALMTFPEMRQLGTSLLASAGVAGLVAGIAARPVLGNLIAGLQIALSQPIRLDDVVIIEGEWGTIEEITSTYIVVKIWDERRLVVPLQWVVEHPLQNWTRSASQLLGTVFLWVDYRVPLSPLRAELTRVCEAAPEWDHRLAMIQVVDANERAIQVRALVSAQDSSKAWDLRCRVREALIDFLQREFPEALPRLRADVDNTPQHAVPKTREPPLRTDKGEL